MDDQRKPSAFTRISACLEDFFQDHRSSAKVFISEKIKCIGDLERHIGGIFKISDFYLACEGHYLPSAEDVRIINSNDMIRVVALKVKGAKSGSASAETEPPVVKKKKKTKTEDLEVVEISDSKKRKRERDGRLDTEHHTEKNATKKKQKNKIVSELGEIDQVEIEYHTENQVGFKKKLKDKYKKDESHNSQQAELKAELEKYLKLKKYLEEHAVFPANKKIKVIEKQEQLSCNSKQHDVRTTYSNHLEEESSSSDDDHQQHRSFEKSTPTLLNVNLPERKTNIVKTIIVSNSQLQNCASNGTNVEQSGQNKSFDGTPDQNTKRKRTRKRKHKSSTPYVHNHTTVSCEPAPPPLIAQNFKGHHIKFEEEPAQNGAINRTDQAVVLNGSSVMTDNVKSDNEKQTNCKLEPVEIDEVKPANLNQNHVKTIQGNGNQVNGVSEIVTDEKSAVEPQINEDFISKYPISSNLEPRINDVIAFRILRMSESYTPEVSSNIIGKVISFDPDSKSINFHISYGLDQCSAPTGKFSLTMDDQPVEDKTSEREFVWTDLLETRLLFP